MKSIDFKTHILPHLIAIGVFFLLVFIFFQPQLLENKALHQHDVFQGRAAGHEGSNFRSNTGEEALWLNNMFSGMPAFLVNVKYKDGVLDAFVKILSLGLPNPASYVFITLISFYILLLSFGVRPYLAIAGAIIFGLSTFNIISVIAGHNSKVHTIGYMPLVLAGVHLAFRNKLLLGFSLTALAMALELKAGHLQMTYYLFLIVVQYGIVQSVFYVREKNGILFLRNVGILIFAVILALMANFGRLWSVYEYSQYTIRGKSELSTSNDNAKPSSGLDREYAFQYSNGIFEPFVLFVPNILGGSSQESLDIDSNLGKAFREQGYSRSQAKQQLQSVPTYWGDQPLTAPYYIGAITLFLFILGIIFAGKRNVYWLLIISLFGIVLSWGKNFEAFNYFLFDHMIGYNKFRSVTFAIIIPMFCMPLLGFLGLENLLNTGWNNETKRKLFIAAGISAGFMLCLALFSGALSFRGAIDERLGNVPNWFLEALRADRQAMLRSDGLRAFFFIAVAFALVWLYLIKKIKPLILSIGLVALVALDMISVGRRFLDDSKFVRDPYGAFKKPTPADQYIKKDNRDGQRALYLLNPFNDARISIHHASVGGYHGAKIGRYQDLISQSLNDEIQSAITNLQSGSRDFRNLGALNMLNTGYFIAGDQPQAVIKNSSANGHAWFVSEVTSVRSAREEINSLNDLNTKSQAVVDTTKFTLSSNRWSLDGQITLNEKKPNYLKYASKKGEKGFAIFSEIFYEKGWKAYIDGVEKPILRANYVLRALEIPSGDHIIEFKFQPDSYVIGSRISQVSGFLLLLLIAFLFYKIASRSAHYS